MMYAVEDRPSIEGMRAFDTRTRKDARGEIKINYEWYVNPKNGNTFALPLDDADARSMTRSSVSRTSHGPNGAVNTYLAKGFRYAKAAEIKAAFERAEANDVINKENDRLRNPLERAKLSAELQARANAGMIREMQNTAAQPKRGAA